MSAPIESLEPRRLLSGAGELDPTFGNHFGLELPAREDRVPARVAVQSDGRIVVAGEARQIDARDSAIVLWRFNRNGTLDRGFGDRGIVREDLTPDEGETVRAIAIDSGGRIVVAGSTVAPGGTYSGTFVARFRRDGSRDATFGDGSGQLISHAINFESDAQKNRLRLAITADGKL